MAAYIQRPDGTALYFDLTDEERHMGLAELTKYPVEDGPDVTDHMRVIPSPFTMRCTITNTPLVPSGNAGQEGVQSTVTINAAPYQPVKSTSGAILDAIVNPIGTVINAITSALSQKDTTVTVPVLVFPTPYDAPTDALFTLDAMQQNREILTIFTSLAEYDDYVLTKYELVKNASTGTGAEVDLTFEPLNIVQTTTASVPIPTEPRGTPKKSKGKQDPAPSQVPKDSILSKATGLKQSTAP